MIINSFGDQEELDCFAKDWQTDTRFSCSVTWKNQFYVFGGENEPQQISRLIAHKLTKVGSLEFSFSGGACTQMNNKLVFLCFDSKDKRKCWKSANPLNSYKSIPSSNSDHGYIQISASKSKLF